MFLRPEKIKVEGFKNVRILITKTADFSCLVASQIFSRVWQDFKCTLEYLYSWILTLVCHVFLSKQHIKVYIKPNFDNLGFPYIHSSFHRILLPEGGEEERNGILLSKLFWPTVRKNCPSDREKLLKFEAEGQEFSKFLRSLEQFVQTVKGQNNLW